MVRDARLARTAKVHSTLSVPVRDTATTTIIRYVLADKHNKNRTNIVSSFLPSGRCLCNRIKHNTVLHYLVNQSGARLHAKTSACVEPTLSLFARRPNHFDNFNTKTANTLDTKNRVALQPHSRDFVCYNAAS